MKKLVKSTITGLGPRTRPSSRRSPALFVGTFILLMASISTAQIPEGSGVKARADDSRLTTDEREQQLLRRLQNQPTSGIRGASGGGGFGRMRFDADEDEIPRPKIEEQAPTKKGDLPTEGVTTKQTQAKPATLLAKETEESDPDQELVDDLNEDLPKGVANQITGKQSPINQDPDQVIKDTQFPSKSLEAKKVVNRDTNLTTGSSLSDLESASDQSLVDIEESQLPSAKNIGVEGADQRLRRDADQPQGGKREVIEALQSASYESLEESAETAHLSRGSQHDQKLDRGATNDRLSMPPKQRAEVDDNSLARSKDNSAEIQAINAQSTANQIQQLEALKENLKLQRELATSQGKLSELSTELEDTKKRLMSAEKQVEELSQRLQHVGDRRIFNSETLANRGSQLGLDYDQTRADPSRRDQPRGSSDSINRGTAIDDRGGARGDEYGLSEGFRDRGGDPRISDMRGSGSNQSLRRAGQSGDSGARERYLEDPFDDRSAPAPGLEIPRQIQSETNTPLVSVTGEDVQLRSGPDKSYPSVMRLRKGERIVVEEQSAAWLQIIAPNGARAWIERGATNFDAIARGERPTTDSPADYRSRRAPRMSVEDRALELIRRGGSQR